MEESYKDIEQRMKNKKHGNIKIDIKKSKKYLINLLTRVFIAVIFVLTSIIITNSSSKNLNSYKEIVLTNNLSFAKINKLYKKYFGSIIPSKIIDDDTNMVFKESITTNEYEEFNDGVKFTVNANAPVDALESGVIVFIGQKENYGKTIIIQGIDGIDYWYGNITNEAVNLYDYVKKNEIIASTSDDKFYLYLIKDGNTLNYEDYMAKD